MKSNLQRLNLCRWSCTTIVSLVVICWSHLHEPFPFFYLQHSKVSIVFRNASQSIAWVCHWTVVLVITSKSLRRVLQHLDTIWSFVFKHSKKNVVKHRELYLWKKQTWVSDNFCVRTQKRLYLLNRF